MSSAIERIKQLNQKRIEAEKAMAEEGKGLFQEVAQTIFTEYPDLTSFSWAQYTPYFNDGDECVFAVNKDYIDFDFAGEPVEEVGRMDCVKRWDGRKWNDVAEENRTPAQRVGEQILNLLGLFSDADYKVMFGDHAEVRVTPSGIDVEHYDHD